MHEAGVAVKDGHGDVATSRSHRRRPWSTLRVSCTRGIDIKIATLFTLAHCAPKYLDEDESEEFVRTVPIFPGISTIIGT